MLQKAITATVDTCIRYAMQVIAIALVLAMACGIYAAKHFALDANANNLVSKDLPWRQREALYDSYFPSKYEIVLAVVDAPTSDSHPRPVLRWSQGSRRTEGPLSQRERGGWRALF